MCSNIGKYDRLLRVILGLVLLIITFFNNLIIGVWAWVAYFFAAVLLITGVVGWCGLYSILGITSKGKALDKITRHDIEEAVKNNAVSRPTIDESLISEKKVVKKAAKKSSKKKVSKKKSSKKKVTKKAVKKSAQ